MKNNTITLAKFTGRLEYEFNEAVKDFVNRVKCLSKKQKNKPLFYDIHSDKNCEDTNIIKLYDNCKLNVYVSDNDIRIKFEVREIINNRYEGFQI